MNDGEDPGDPSAGSGEPPDASEEPTEATEEWRFTLEDIEAREAQTVATAEAEERRREPIEPGDPSLENAFFVLVGVLFALFVISRLFVG
jgi:Ca2+/Na+ antiporter